MTTEPMELTTATESDVEYVRRLLREHGLPTDVDRVGVSLFVGRVDGRRIGVGGLEGGSPYALVRSVAVEPEVRGEGYGTALVERLCERARERKVRELYLLTEGAAGFFETLGFEPIERGAVPKTIRETSEFAEGCPASAACLHRNLG